LCLGSAIERLPVRAILLQSKDTASIAQPQIVSMHP
jgi:hypothetical protein